MLKLMLLKFLVKLNHCVHDCVASHVLNYEATKICLFLCRFDSVLLCHLEKDFVW